MARKKGAKNVQPFEKRGSVATTSNADIKHLADSRRSTHLDAFKSLLDHQTAYLKWIDDRHKELKKTKTKLAIGNRGPKDATYKKYKWYAEQQSLFESINAFEVFYKQTFISLAQAIREYVPPEKLRGSVDSKILWSIRGRFSIPALVFEHQLFHDLDKVDETSAILVGEKRYNIGSAKKTIKERIRALDAIFQIRHTFAHNQGVVTTSDSAKLKMRGYTATAKEVIDPAKDQLGNAIRKLLKQEAEEYTKWLLDSTADYLKKYSTEKNVPLYKNTRSRLEKKIGTSSKIASLVWVDP